MGDLTLDPTTKESFSDRLYDAVAPSGVHFPDPALVSGTRAFGTFGQKLFRITVTADTYQVETVGPLPSGKMVGLAVDPADAQMLYLLMAEKEAGRYRLVRGTGRKEWETFSNFMLPLPIGSAHDVLRVPLRGLSAQDDALVLVAEFVEEDAPGDGLWHSRLDTYSLSLHGTELFPVLRSSLEDVVWTLPKADSDKAYFQTQDFACAPAFTRRAFSLNLFSDDRDCPTRPLQVGSRPAALLHAVGTQKTGARAVLATSMEEAHAVSALEASHSLLLARGGDLEVYDAWLEEKGDQSVVRLDRHKLSQKPSAELSPSGQWEFLAGFDTPSQACALASTAPVFSSLDSLMSQAGPSLVSQTAQMLKPHLQAGLGRRCPCAFLTQAQAFVKTNASGRSGATQVQQAISEEGAVRGCVLPPTFDT